MRFWSSLAKADLAPLTRFETSRQVHITEALNMSKFEFMKFVLNQIDFVVYIDSLTEIGIIMFVLCQHVF